MRAKARGRQRERGEAKERSSRLRAIERGDGIAPRFKPTVRKPRMSYRPVHATIGTVEIAFIGEPSITRRLTAT